MSANEINLLTKIRTSLPWLARYPFVRARDLFGREPLAHKHIIFTVANHFEPAWKESGLHDLKTQIRRLQDYHKLARETGEALRDADGTKFRHGNFYPAEQYHPELLEIVAEMQSQGLGEVEIHLHHGVEKPDTAEDLRRSLVDFRDCLAEEHKCLSRENDNGSPMYAFVHGNLALANSYGGKYCGVDSEMQILQDTGCYADMTLPSAPVPTQVPMINQIYECGLPLTQKAPHSEGISVAVNGKQPLLPLIFTGPLVFNWQRRVRGLPIPRVDDGGLTFNQKLDQARFERWLSANIIVKGRPDWVFVKLYCHGFIDQDQSACIGEEAKRFFSEIIERGEKTSAYDVHFATPREAFNMVKAAIDGKVGSPGDFRDYHLRAIMDNAPAKLPISKKESILIC
jgi:hypothetical protein